MNLIKNYDPLELYRTITNLAAWADEHHLVDAASSLKHTLTNASLSEWGAVSAQQEGRVDQEANFKKNIESHLTRSAPAIVEALVEIAQTIKSSEPANELFTLPHGTKLDGVAEQLATVREWAQGLEKSGDESLQPNLQTLEELLRRPNKEEILQPVNRLASATVQVAMGAVQPPGTGMAEKTGVAKPRSDTTTSDHRTRTMEALDNAQFNKLYPHG